MLPRDRLLPDLQAWTPRKILACLLDADEPLSQAEIARREGICAASVANNRDQLEALALIERTKEGWVFGLPDRESVGRVVMARRGARRRPLMLMRIPSP